MITNDKGMQYVAHCIKNLEGLGNNDFKPAEVDISNYVTIVETRKNDSSGHPIKDVDGNYVIEEVEIITNRQAYNRNRELQRHQIKRNEDEQE